jgi:hypothetical protein
MRQAVPLINVIRENTVFSCHNTRCLHVLSLILNKGTKRSDETMGAPHLVLCESCLWCASCLTPGVTVVKCPNCNYHTVESMPIFDNEVHRGYSSEECVRLDI